MNHRLTEHRGHGGETEGEDGGENSLEAGDDEAVEAVDGVYGAKDHVQKTYNDGRDTTEEELR